MKRFFKLRPLALHIIMLGLALSIAGCKKETASTAIGPLTATIQAASDLVNSAKEGVTLGQYAPGSKANLQAKIDWANFIKNNSGNDVAYLNAKKTLEDATASFKANTVKPGTPKFAINSFFELGSVDDLVPNKSNFTMELKVKLSDLLTDGTAKLGGFITIDDKSLGILFRYTNTGAIAAYIHNGGYIGATTPANTLTVDKWYHLTYTFNGSVITIYVDGVKKATANISGGPKPANIAAGSPVRLGMSRNNIWTATDLRSMHGNLKDVRFWNYALTEVEVNTNMSKTLTGTETGLIAYWPFDLNLGNSVPSSVGKFTAVATNITWE
ncbi:LamG domain-containing protein [Mucilaginibacter sp. UYCu711]|uniref:LamG domain-containing protein n=1 Tax=Mucilaginibacter sp. UYCu711 TaxID=3156339 RepID=UPI003D236928